MWTLHPDIPHQSAKKRNHIFGLSSSSRTTIPTRFPPPPPPFPVPNPDSLIRNSVTDRQIIALQGALHFQETLHKIFFTISSVTYILKSTVCE
jgi:hypothetical protein